MPNLENCSDAAAQTKNIFPNIKSYFFRSLKTRRLENTANFICRLKIIRLLRNILIFNNFKADNSRKILLVFCIVKNMSISFIVKWI